MAAFILRHRLSTKKLFFFSVFAGMLLTIGCSENAAPDENIHVSQIARYSIYSSFHIENSGAYPDSLAPIYPNPFNRTTGDSVVTIFFTTKDTGEVKIIIQNPIGDSVAIFRDSLLPPGSFTGLWQPVTSNGTRLHAGLYFITMHAAPDDPNRNYINSRLLQIQSN